MPSVLSCSSDFLVHILRFKMCLAIVPVIALLASVPYVEGARVPITSYVCTQPHYPFLIDANQCSVTSGLRTCETKGGVHPNLLNGDDTTRNGIYVWKNNTNPFVLLDIPQGWCVGSVKMTFLRTGGIPTASLSVHSAERFSTNTNRTMFSISELHNRAEGGTQVVMSLATLACGRYLRINMTSDRALYLTEIEVFGTSFSACMPSTAAASPTLSGPEVQPSPRHPPTYNASSTDMGCSIGISSAVFFVGLLAGVALAGPAGALSVSCYHWKKKRARTRGKDTKASEDKEPAYDFPLKLEENPAYEAMQK